MMTRKNILIVDDHMVMRTGLKTLLRDFYPGLHFFEADNGESALVILKQQKPDMVILDLQLPDTDTIRLIELINIKYPGLYILVFSMLSESMYGQRALTAGASGFLSKGAQVDEVKKAFDLAFAHKRYLSQDLVELMAGQVYSKTPLNPFEKLSQREFEIIHLLLKGKNLTDIGQALNLKPSTVGTYKSRVFEKINVSTIFELHQVAALYGMNYLFSTTL